MGSSSPNRGENKTCLKPPPSLGLNDPVSMIASKSVLILYTSGVTHIYYILKPPLLSHILDCEICIFFLLVCFLLNICHPQTLDLLKVLGNSSKNLLPNGEKW